MNGVELRHLRALVVMAEEAHYGRAATRLHMAQSTLSRTLTDLESLVGLRLIDRAQRTAGLTEPGRALLGAAEHVLATVHDGLQAARDAPGPVPTLGLMGAHGYRWLAATGRLLGPGAFTVRELGASEGFSALGRDVDVAICPMPFVDPPNLRVQTLARSAYWVALARGHRLAGSTTVELRHVAHFPLLLPANDQLSRSNLELVFRAQGLQLCLGPAPRTMLEALSMVAEDAGWAVAAARADFRPWDGVALRMLTGVDRLRIAAVWEPSRDTPAVQRLVEALAVVAEAGTPRSHAA